MTLLVSLLMRGHCKVRRFSRAAGEVKHYLAVSCAASGCLLASVEEDEAAAAAAVVCEPGDGASKICSLLIISETTQVFLLLKGREGVILT